MKSPNLYNEINQRITSFINNEIDLPGIANPINKDIFIRQLIDSYRRISYVSFIKNRDINIERSNPHSLLYDPIKAAIYFNSQQDINESIWNVLIFTHFGRDLKNNYELARSVYGKLNACPYWKWNVVVTDLDGFKYWLSDNIVNLKAKGKFGNHRKYQSLKVDTHAGTFQTVESYINLIGDDHKFFFNQIDEKITLNRFSFFDYLFNEFQDIKGFGRLAVFDFLCMIGKVGILNIEPSSPYLGNGGPINGAKLLFGIDTGVKNLNDSLSFLGQHAFPDYPFIMQILEDAVCNWQKSPMNYKLFRG